MQLARSAFGVGFDQGRPVGWPCLINSPPKDVGVVQDVIYGRNAVLQGTPENIAIGVAGSLGVEYRPELRCGF
jgi:hypothetical protein